jgi:hypothetical protein
MKMLDQRLHASDGTSGACPAEPSFIPQTPDVDPCQPEYNHVALCAYFIWLSEGCPHGRDQEHWLNAEKQLHLTCRHDLFRKS